MITNGLRQAGVVSASWVTVARFLPVVTAMSLRAPPIFYPLVLMASRGGGMRLNVVTALAARVLCRVSGYSVYRFNDSPAKIKAKLGLLQA